MDDLISRRAAIDALGDEPEVWSGRGEYGQGLNKQWHYDVNALKALSSAQPEIIRCKDCKKHNIGIGDYEEWEQGRKWFWKDEACPLVAYRGKAQGHEYDYQYCVFGERKEE